MRRPENSAIRTDDGVFFEPESFRPLGKGCSSWSLPSDLTVRWKDVAQRTLPIVDRSGEHCAHAQVALDPPGGFVVEPVDPHERPDQVGQHGQLDPGSSL